MTDFEKENVLRKVVASSAFLLSLSILPIAQHYFVGDTGQLSGSGVVKGVSTSVPTTPGTTTFRGADLPQPTPDDACLAKKQKDLSDLQLFDDGEKAAILRNYEQKKVEYQQYLNQLAAVEAAVGPQKKAIESRSCLP
ncbi:hypothetical protein KGQ71_00955 [Patescibacteria group bacterium]|nr:hypothetical protein [Patescibacteria group bacterium]